MLAATLLLVGQPALAARRVALVLGNSAYQNVAPLPNPVNDSAVIAAKLKEAGFDVVDSRHDLTAAETRRVLRDFADRAGDADIAVVYYAGHGMEVDGDNFLIPVDAKLERDTDVFDEALSLDRILVAIEPAKQLRLVILDACRDNPFAKTMKRTAASRAIGRGLAGIEPSSPNTLIAYSARAGSTALDGEGRNSPFTLALARYLTTPGLDVRKAFGFVRDDVLKTTGNRQEPFVYGSLGGNDLPLVPAKAMPPAAAATPQADARRDYELALQLGNKDAFKAFLTQYPDGFYARLARLQLDKLTAEGDQIAASEKARQNEQERAKLVAEGAQRAQQARADTDAKAAEQARIAAEKVKQLLQDQAAEAERKRIGSEGSAALPERVAAANAAIDNGAAGLPAAGKIQIERSGANLAALKPAPPPADLAKSLQTELRRVGCLTAAADGEWNAASQRSLTLFNRYAGTKFDVRLASADALGAIRLKSSRICPLVCEHGFRPDGGHCDRIVCAEGLSRNGENECERPRSRAPFVRRDDDDRLVRVFRERLRPEASMAAPQASGQIVCDRAGCRPVEYGCHLEFRLTWQGGPREGGGGNVEICD